MHRLRADRDYAYLSVFDFMFFRGDVRKQRVSMGFFPDIFRAGDSLPGDSATIREESVIQSLRCAASRTRLNCFGFFKYFFYGVPAII